jgi:hypothetical protein
MTLKSLRKWGIVVAVLVPMILMVQGLSDLARAIQPEAWTTITLGAGGRRAGDFFLDVDLDVDSRDPNNQDDDNIYIAATRWEGDNFVLYLYVSKDSGATWTKYKIKTCEGLECFQARVAVDSFKEVDIVAVGWQDFTPGNWDIFVQTFCSPKPAVEALPPGPPCDGTPLQSDPKEEPRDTYTEDPQPYPLIPLTPEMVNISKSDATSGNHEIGGREWTGSWDLAISSHPQCLTDGFPFVWTIWAEDINADMLYSLSKDGKSWSAPAKLPFASGQTRFPSAYNDSNGVMYAGSTLSVSPAEVYLTASNDCGATWGPVVNLSNNAGFSDAPRVAVTDDGKVHVVWDDVTGTANVDNFYTQCTRDGNVLNCAPARSAVKDGAFPDIATDGKNLFMAYRSTPGGRTAGLGFSCSTDGGATWIPAYELPDSALASPTFTMPWGVHLLRIVTIVNPPWVYVTWVQVGPNFTKVKLAKRTGCG